MRTLFATFSTTLALAMACWPLHAANLEISKVYDLAEDFSTNRNPTGVWWYGWKGTLEGPTTLLSSGKWSTSEDGVSSYSWKLSEGEFPAVRKVFDSRPQQQSLMYHPDQGALVLIPGDEAAPENYSVVRFNVPVSGGGNYLLVTRVSGVFDFPFQGDFDFHILTNGVRIVDEFLEPQSALEITNSLVLAEGDTLEIVVGRGSDRNDKRSHVQVSSRLTLVSELPMPLSAAAQTPKLIFDLAQDFCASKSPINCWQYGWIDSAEEKPSFFNECNRIDSNKLDLLCWQSSPDSGISLCQVLRFGRNHQYVESSRPIVGSVFLAVGREMRKQRRGVVRFTAPPELGMSYRIEAQIADFGNQGSRGASLEVRKNGIRREMPIIFRNSAGVTNVLDLAGGDTIDFIIGPRTEPREEVARYFLTFRLLADPTHIITRQKLGPVDSTASWSFSGSVEDDITKLQGELIGEPRFVVGKLGQALRFDGRDDAVRIPASGATDIGRGPGLSIVFWIKVRDVRPWGTIAEWTPSKGSTPGVHILVSAAGDGSIFANFMDTNGASHHLTTVPGVIAAGEYHHIALTYERRSGVGKVFVNGRVVSATVLGEFVPDTRYDLWLGRRILGDRAYRLRGDLDDLDLFNRPLSGSEIRLHCLQGLLDFIKPRSQ